MARCAADLEIDYLDPDRPGVDLPAAEEAVRELLRALGLDPAHREGLASTPRRVAAYFAEMLAPRPFELTTFPNEGYDEMVLVRDIPFRSLCEHHLLPFTGVAHVAYLPGERIAGLSKLARVVDMFAHRLQVQERMTSEVADYLQASLAPKGVGVVIEAEHLCMSLRGVAKPGTITVTSAVHGTFREDARTRQEFLSLIGRRDSEA